MIRPATPARVTVQRAVVAGGLYCHPREAIAVSAVLSKPNPEYKSWLRRSKRMGHSAGPPPTETYLSAGPLWDGPHAGSWWLPRHAPIRVVDAIDATTMPPAEALTLRVTPRPYQVAAVDAVLWERSGVVVAPCGGGKTTIGALAMARLDTPALVLVNTLDLATQWIERCREQLGVEAGLVGDGVRDDEGKRIVVATIQTLATWPWSERFEWGRRFGFVLLDEAHHVPARTFAEVLAALPARYRLGLTATPDRPDGLGDILYWSCGAKVYQVTQRELEEQGYTLRPRITWIPTGFRTETSAEDWSDLVDEMATDEARNAVIVREVAARAAAGRTCLLLATRVAHCEGLAEQLGALGVPSRALVGKLTRKRRGEVLGQVKAGELRAVIATSLGDEALDLPEVDVVALVGLSKNDGKVQQRVGRACRPRPGKPQPEVLDFVDSFGPAIGAAKKRRSLYRRLGWDPPALPEVSRG